MSFDKERNLVCECGSKVFETLGRLLFSVTIRFKCRQCGERYDRIWPDPLTILGKPPGQLSTIAKVPKEEDDFWVRKI
jgi:DNA-directed RNA polymerase subunit RPC12/RpoP